MGRGGHRPRKEPRKTRGGQFFTDEVLAERRDRKARTDDVKPWDGQPAENAERHRSFLDGLLKKTEES